MRFQREEAQRIVFHDAGGVNKAIEYWYGRQHLAVACELGQVEVRTVEGDTYTDSYCATQAEYEALVAEAEGQYAAALKNGKLVYQDWLTDRKLSPKTEKARETAAQKYLCQTSPDFGDGALYAATKAGLPESELNFAIGNALITIDGYDPTDQACSNGKPVPRPNPPQPKDPSRDPAANGNAPSADERNVPDPEPPAPTRERPGELQDP